MVGPGGGGGMNTMGGGEDYEEDVVIGGKMLPGWMENGEARSEGQKVAKMLDEFDLYVVTLYVGGRLLMFVQSPIHHSTISRAVIEPLQ